MKMSLKTQKKTLFSFSALKCSFSWRFILSAEAGLSLFLRPSQMTMRRKKKMRQLFCFFSALTTSELQSSFEHLSVSFPTLHC